MIDFVKPDPHREEYIVKPDPHNEEWRNKLRDLLRRGNVDIKFEKKDGTIREMNCTLNEDTISRDGAEPKGTGRAKSDDVQPVYDVEKSGWRSFRWDSLIEISIDLGPDL